MVLLLVDFEKYFGRHVVAGNSRHVCVFFYFFKTFFCYFFYFVSPGVSFTVSLPVSRLVVSVIVGDNKVSRFLYRRAYRFAYHPRNH